MTAVAVQMPSTPPPTPGPRGARALARILAEAHRRQAEQREAA